MATLREIICASGVNTLREYMCVETGGFEGDVYITHGVISLSEKKSILLKEVSIESLTQVDITNVSEVEIESIDEVEIDTIDRSC